MSITLAPVSLALRLLHHLQPASAFEGVQRPDGTSASREGIFPGRYSEIFGRGERPACILNLGHSFDAIEAYLQIY